MINLDMSFKVLANTLPHIVWIADTEGKTYFLNTEWFNYTGLTEFGERSDRLKVIHKDDLDLCLSSWQKSVLTSIPYEIEYRIKNKETGKYRWFLGRAYPILDDTGIVTSWFGTVIDIHEKKSTTDWLMKSMKEISEENNTCKHKLTLLRDKLKSVLDEYSI